MKPSFSAGEIARDFVVVGGGSGGSHGARHGERDSSVASWCVGSGDRNENADGDWTVRPTLQSLHVGPLERVS
jgi:hypothetical protein